jgi:Flp pilus assembly protein TadB
VSGLLPTALQGLADRTGLASLRRFVDGVVIAVQRGTPLADVLRAQAQDVREEGRRAIMEAGGRKAIAIRAQRRAVSLRRIPRDRVDRCGTESLPPPEPRSTDGLMVRR